MRHALSISGYGTRLRPVTPTDAGFIARLRNLPHALGKVGDSAPDEAAQQRWLEAYWERQGDYYFIVESVVGESWGTIGIYDLTGTSAEWGRWILLHGIPAALPSVVLIHQLAFDMLGLTELRVCVLAENRAVVSFHRRFGALDEGVEQGARQIGGKCVDLVRLRMPKVRWLELQAERIQLAKVAAQSLPEPHRQL